MFEFLKLPNGLEILAETDASAKSLALGLFVKTGARHEPNDAFGVSHFLEHMAFKGSAQFNGKDLNRAFDALGASINAFTNDELTVFHGAVLTEQQNDFAKLLFELLSPILPNEEIERERNVILEEIEMYEDEPDSRLFTTVRQLYFGSHPAGREVLGTRDSVRSLTRQQLLHYHSARYASQNMLLVATGRLDWDALLNSAASLNNKKIVDAAVSEVLAPRAGEIHLEDDRVARVHLAFFAPGVAANDPRREAAEILAEAVGGGEGARMYWALVNDGLCSEANFEFEVGQSESVFTGGLSCDPEHLEEAMSRLKTLFLDLETNGLSRQEFFRAKKKLLVSSVLRAETPYGRLFPLAFAWLERGAYRSSDDERQAIEMVTLDEVNGLLASGMLSRLALGTLSPEK